MLKLPSSALNSISWSFATVPEAAIFCTAKTDAESPQVSEQQGIYVKITHELYSKELGPVMMGKISKPRPPKNLGARLIMEDVTGKIFRNRISVDDVGNLRCKPTF